MATEYDFLLLETGDHLLLEDGGKLIIAEREVSVTTTGAGGYYQRRVLIPMPGQVPRRRYGWIDIEDEELLLILDDIEVV